MAGAEVAGRYIDGVFWFIARRADGRAERFLFRWQATAWANGWEPPAAFQPRIKVEGAS